MASSILLVTKENDIVRLLHITLLQMSGYIKHFENGRKKMYFVIKDDVLDKSYVIWKKIKNALNIKFHTTLVYHEQYIRAKAKKINDVIKTNFLDDEIPKEKVHYASIACITIDSVITKKIIHKFIQKNTNTK